MASTRPSASRTYRTSRRRPSANTAAQWVCHVQPRKGQRRRAAPATASQAAASAGSRRSAHSIFTGSPRTRTSCGFALPSQARLGRGRPAASHSHHRLASDADVLRLRTPITGSPRTRTSCGFALPSQFLRRAGGARGFIIRRRRALAAITGLGHRLVDGGVEVVTELVAEFLAHLLHEARDARRIVLVEITRSPALRQRLEPRLLRLHGGEARHQPAQRRRAAARTRGGLGRREAADEQAHAAPAVVALV